jgi:hypothetical protein
MTPCYEEVVGRCANHVPHQDEGHPGWFGFQTGPGKGLRWPPPAINQHPQPEQTDDETRYQNAQEGPVEEEKEELDAE